MAARKSKKATAKSFKYANGQFVVYPTHGVGQVVDVEEQDVAGFRLQLYVINFEKEKMRLRVPVGKCDAVGMRGLASKATLERALKVLAVRARVKRTMWSRRAQEYEAKINSGDLIAVTEVVRDLFRSRKQPEQSYSERQLYEIALDRMAREVAAIRGAGENRVVQELEELLENAPHRLEKAGKAAQNDGNAGKAA